MFLLIQYLISPRKLWEQLFTFHNVSINTKIHHFKGFSVVEFTFHNVSINTGYKVGIYCNMDIYIPQCFY